MEDKELTKQCECSEECTCQEEEMNLEDLLGQLNAIPPIQLDDDTMDQICNSEEFSEGIADVLKVCGSVTALVNCGLTVESAMDYILTMETMKHNMEMQKLNNQCSVEISKNQALQVEKAQL